MAATANRRIFVNWEKKRLQTSDKNAGEFTFPNFIKYETIPLEICIVESDLSGARIESFRRVDVSPLSISIAISETLDDATPLVYQNVFTKDEDLNVFRGELAMNTALMNAYIGASTGTLSAWIEIEMQEGTARSKIYVAQITLQNSVTTAASAVPIPTDEYLTKAQQNAQFVQKVMPAGEQVTMTSPSGNYQRVFGVGDGGEAIDQILPV